MSSIHWHGCPECYEKYPCNMDCTIAWEDEEDGRQFGSYWTCDSCAKSSEEKNIESVPKDLESLIAWYRSEAQKKNPSKTWWDIYCGTRKKLR